MKDVEIQYAGGHSTVPIFAGAAGPVSRDTRTGLPDESALRARVQQALDTAGAPSAALLAVDCSGLRDLADRLGSDVAVRMHVELARRLRQHAGPGDFLTRAGDDGFALLLGSLDHPTSAERVAGAIVHDLTRPVPLETGDATAHASVGVAIAPTHGTDAVSLIASAGAALREARRLGGDTYLLAR